MRSGGGHDSTEVQNGSAPVMPSVCPGVNGVDMTAGVRGAAGIVGVA